MLLEPLLLIAFGIEKTVSGRLTIDTLIDTLFCRYEDQLFRKFSNPNVQGL